MQRGKGLMNLGLIEESQSISTTIMQYCLRDCHAGLVVRWSSRGNSHFYPGVISISH